MQSGTGLLENFGALVSCDLVGHGLQNVETQVSRIQAINEIVWRSIDCCGECNIIWASSGDGGHVIFTGPQWPEQALKLILTLDDWSTLNEAPLRISAHYGPIYMFKGADGRTQVVGDAINMCGSMITFGSEFGVVVSDSFRREMEKVGLDTIRFHDYRVVYLKHFSAQVLCLMSAEPSLSSKWGSNSVSEHRMLEEALAQVNKSKKQLCWNIIHHAKRLLQVDPGDQRALNALISIQPFDLNNPFLGKMDKPKLLEFIKLAQLISREDAEVICEQGDNGDAMFIVLTGEVGVVSGEPNDFLNTRIGAGEIVGELASYLKRTRTAALQAVGRTSLLSFNNEDLERLVGKTKDEVNLGINNFFVNRVLEHLCNHVSYLRQAFENEQKMPWDLIKGAEIETFDWKDQGTLSPHSEFFQRNGLYILATGSLKRQLGGGALKIHGKDFPIVYADFPGHIVHAYHLFAIDSDLVKLVFIPVSSLQEFGRICFGRLVSNIKQSILCQFSYDVFISYNNKDQDVAYRWKLDFERAGLKVYMNTLDPMHRFKPQIADAIRDALVLLAFVSSNTAVQSPSESWVGREIEYRRCVFNEAYANILPIKLTGGSVSTLGEGFSPIDAIGREREAIQEAINTIQSVREGQEVRLPMALKRITDISL